MFLFSVHGEMSNESGMDALNIIRMLTKATTGGPASIFPTKNVQFWFWNDTGFIEIWIQRSPMVALNKW